MDAPTAPLSLALLSVGATSIVPAHAADSTIRVEGGGSAASQGLQEGYVDCLFPTTAGKSVIVKGYEHNAPAGRRA